MLLILKINGLNTKNVQLNLTKMLLILKINGLNTAKSY